MQGKWLIIAALFPLLSFSQGNKSGTHINTIASVGVASGESAAKPLFQLESGLSVGQWYAGIGAGVDYYKFKSIPLFADWRFHLGSAFVYASGGYNIPFKNKSTDEYYYATNTHFYGGMYMDAGVGYRIRISSANRLSLSAGYSQKNINEKIGSSFQCLTSSCPEESYTYHYTLGRIVAKLCLEIGW